MIRILVLITVYAILSLSGGCAYSLGGSASRSANFVPERHWPQSQSKRIEWTAGQTTLSYLIEFELLEDGSVRVQLDLRNTGKKVVLLLTEQEWVVVARNQIAYITLGSREFSYGNELPVLRAVPPGEKVEVEGKLALPILGRDVEALVIGFLGIFEHADALATRLSELENVSGWWQTSDVNLADRYQGLLVYHPVEFPLAPHRPK